MNAEAAAFWRDWIDGGRDVPGLRLHTITLVERMRLASQNDDWEQFQRLLEAYSYVVDYCQDEPLFTAYENGLLYAHLDLADSMWLKGDLVPALEHIAWVGSTLGLGDERRSQAGMVPRPNSELRYTYLGIQAACYLEDPSLFAQGAPELETMLLSSEFWKVANVAQSNLATKYESDSEDLLAALHNLSRWELEICKLCERNAASLLSLAVETFNRRIGHHLELETRHFARHVDGCDQSSWYWDFELSKLETLNDFGCAEVLFCYKQRSTSARLSFAKGPSKTLQQPWERQLHRMRERCRS